MSFTDTQVHSMCSYLRSGEDKPCLKCDREVETPYGLGVPGCFGLALETLEKAAAISDPGVIHIGSLTMVDAAKEKL